ncbi:MAG: RNA polymerase sigma factor [Anaerovoracaceae bacterium]
MLFSRLTKEEQEKLLLDQMQSGWIFLKAFPIQESDAEEILQETIITIWRRYETLHSPSKVKAWGRTILKNKIRKYYRRRKIEWARCVSFSQYEEEHERSPISEQLVYKEMERFEDTELYEMIMHLGFPANTILQLHYQYDESFEEIARMLHMKSGTVRSIACRSREKLKEMILAEADGTKDGPEGSDC